MIQAYAFIGDKGSNRAKKFIFTVVGVIKKEWATIDIFSAESFPMRETTASISNIFCWHSNIDFSFQKIIYNKNYEKRQTNLFLHIVFI